MVVFWLAHWIFNQTVERLEVGGSRLGWSLHYCVVSSDTKLPLFVQVYKWVLTAGDNPTID